jgi:hypothetical protein
MEVIARKWKRSHVLSVPTVQRSASKCLSGAYILHPDTFSLSDREQPLARDVTALYGFLPAFYVNAVFINSGENDIWIGGKPKTNFVWIRNRAERTK